MEWAKRAGRSWAAVLLFALTTSLAVPQPRPLEASASNATHRVSVRFAAGLEYLLIEPSGVSPDAELPMLVYLHGRGGRPVAPAGALYGVETPMRVIMPRAPDRESRGFAWMPVSASRGESPALNEALTARTALLAAALDTWRSRHPTRGRPLVVGYSQGGILALSLALHEPAAVGAAFPLAAWLPPSLMPEPASAHLRLPEVHALHGADDRVLSAPRTRETMRGLRDLGYPIRFEVFPEIGHSPEPPMYQRLRGLIERAIERELESDSPAGHV